MLAWVATAAMEGPLNVGHVVHRRRWMVAWWCLEGGAPVEKPSVEGLLWIHARWKVLVLIDALSHALEHV